MSVVDHAEVLAHVEGVVEELHAGHGELRDLLERMQEPATLSTIVLTSTQPTKYDEPSTEAKTRSIGFLNPTAATVFFGLNGGTASAVARAPSVPPKALLVLPVAVTHLEIGANPTDLAAGDAVIYVMRFQSVQPAFLGRVA